VAERKKKRKPAKAPHAPQQPGAIGVAWYRAEDYDRLKSMYEDADQLPDTFEEWLAIAEGVRNTMIAQGFIIRKVYLDPDTFPQWCKEHGLSMDATGRTRYALLAPATT
jgi:hypothetical protein